MSKCLKFVLSSLFFLFCSDGRVSAVALGAGFFLYALCFLRSLRCLPRLCLRCLLAILLPCPGRPRLIRRLFPKPAWACCGRIFFLGLRLALFSGFILKTVYLCNLGINIQKMCTLYMWYTVVYNMYSVYLWPVMVDLACRLR